MATTTITAENQNPLSPVERVEPHFYASGLISQGCDVVTVQRALGHASATTTLSTYAHLWPSAEDRTRKAAEALILEALDSTTDGDDLADSSRTGEP